MYASCQFSFRSIKTSSVKVGKNLRLLLKGLFHFLWLEIFCRPSFTSFIRYDDTTANAIPCSWNLGVCAQGWTEDFTTFISSNQFDLFEKLERFPQWKSNILWIEIASLTTNIFHYEMKLSDKIGFQKSNILEYT